MVKTGNPENVSLASRIDHLMASLMLGYSRVSSTAYDTTWTARLVNHFPGAGFKDSLEWLRDYQHRDGSWGSPIFHQHDRIVSTLAAIVALKEVGDRDDEYRIQLGQTFLWHNSANLHYDANDTIAYPIIMSTLVKQAYQLGIDIPDRFYRDSGKIEKKLRMLSNYPEMWRATTLHHSLEAIIDHLPPGVQFDLSDEIGCVGSSPSATAAALMHPQTRTGKSMAYLQNLMGHQGDGGVPNVDRIDVVEGAWAINNLIKDNLIKPDDPQVRRVLDALWNIWSNEHGVSFSSSFGVPDLDDTSVAFAVLSWGGYPVNPDVFTGYESGEHFNCFRGELDPSMSAHIRMLAALQWVKDAPQYKPWSEKIIRFLRANERHGYFCFDKWHVSPYYLSGPMVWLLHGVMDDVLIQRIKWISMTQNQDGGWGFYGQSTLEETAYCLQALLYADQNIQRVDSAVLKSGADFFMRNVQKQDYPPLWIGKGLYTPYFVVESSIIATLYGLSNYL